MKPHSLRLIERLLVFAAASLSLAFASLAAQTPATASAQASPVSTNALPAQPEIPKSVFLIPSRPQEGKDPFFPLSMRLFASAVVKTSIQPTIQPTPAPAVELRLNGISGPVDHRLAIINNHTFEANEEGEVPTHPGHARIRCLEIKLDSVLIQVGAEQRVLHLRPAS